MVEMLCVVDILVRGASEQAQALGESKASLVQGRRQVWLAQSKLATQDCSAVFAAPVVLGEVFRPPRFSWGRGGDAPGFVPSSSRCASGPGPSSGPGAVAQGHFRGDRRTGSAKSTAVLKQRPSLTAVSLRLCASLLNASPWVQAPIADQAPPVSGYCSYRAEGRRRAPISWSWHC